MFVTPRAGPSLAYTLCCSLAAHSLALQTLPPQLMQYSRVGQGVQGSDGCAQWTVDGGLSMCPASAAAGASLKCARLPCEALIGEPYKLCTQIEPSKVGDGGSRAQRTSALLPGQGVQASSLQGPVCRQRAARLRPLADRWGSCCRPPPLTPPLAPPSLAASCPQQTLRLWPAPTVPGARR